MRRYIPVAAVLTVVLALPPMIHGDAGRGAKTGAASGAVLSFLLGGDIFDVAEGAATGAAVGAVGGAVAGSGRKRRAERAELERLRRREIEMLEYERARAREEEQMRYEALAREAERRRAEEERYRAMQAEQRRTEEQRYRAEEAETRRLEEQRAAAAREETRRLEEERRKLAEERRKLEEALAASRSAAQAQAAGASPSGYPQTEEEWIAAVGEDNFSAVNALIDCQHDRARLLAQAGRTVDNPNFQLASRWIEALVAVDQKDRAAANALFEELAIVDSDVDTVQQASLLADQTILDVRKVRREESITCDK